tara:strand:+ start:70 stop:294 length:225 start_codon:yes stop_codon:yes gene_type:complete
MIESFTGILIAAMAISTLMLSIQALEKSFRNAGKNSLTQQELEIIKSAGFNSDNNIMLLNRDINNFPQKYNNEN